MNIAQAKRDFLEYVELEKGLSLKTVTNYDRYLSRFFEFSEIEDTDDINEGAVKEFRLWFIFDGQPHVKRCRLPLQDGFERSLDDCLGNSSWSEILAIVRQMREGTDPYQGHPQTMLIQTKTPLVGAPDYVECLWMKLLNPLDEVRSFAEFRPNVMRLVLPRSVFDMV